MFGNVVHKVIKVVTQEVYKNSVHWTTNDSSNMAEDH